MLSKKDRREISDCLASPVNYDDNSCVNCGRQLETLENGRILKHTTRNCLGFLRFDIQEIQRVVPINTPQVDLLPQKSFTYLNNPADRNATTDAILSSK